MLCWRGVRITYLDLKLCVVFLRVTWSDIIVLVQSLFLSRELMKKMLPSLVAWLNEIVTTTWSLHGFRTLLFPPSPTCWATLMMQVSMEYVGQKVLHYSRLHEILVSGWIASIQARTRAIHQWLLCSNDAQQYASIRDEFRLYEFLMSLYKDFEPIRGQLLNRGPAPSLDIAVNKLVREEARHATLQDQNKFNVLAITPSAPLIEQPQQSGDSSSSSNRRK